MIKVSFRTLYILGPIILAILITIPIDSINDSSRSILATFFSIGAGICISSIAIFSSSKLLETKNWRYIHFYQQYVNAKVLPISLLLALYIISIFLLALNGFESNIISLTKVKIVANKISIFMSLLSILYTIMLPRFITSIIQQHLEEIKQDKKSNNI